MGSFDYKDDGMELNDGQLIVTKKLGNPVYIIVMYNFIIYVSLHFFLTIMETIITCFNR